MPAPVVDLALLRAAPFGFSLVSFVLCMLALFAVSFLLPFYFEELRGFDVERSGLLLTPLSLTLAVVAPISALADRIGSRWLSPIGLAIACAGLLLLGRLTATSPIRDVDRCPRGDRRSGRGCSRRPNTRTLMAAAPRGAQGVASGLLATGRVLGQSLSVSLAGAVFAGRGGTAAGERLAGRVCLSPAALAGLQHTFVGAMRAAFIVCASLSAVGVVTALVRGEAPPRPSS